MTVLIFFFDHPNENALMPCLIDRAACEQETTDSRFSFWMRYSGSDYCLLLVWVCTPQICDI